MLSLELPLNCRNTEVQTQDLVFTFALGGVGRKGKNPAVYLSVTGSRSAEAHCGAPGLTPGRRLSQGPTWGGQSDLTPSTSRTVGTCATASCSRSPAPPALLPLLSLPAVLSRGAVPAAGRLHHVAGGHISAGTFRRASWLLSRGDFKPNAHAGSSSTAEKQELLIHENLEKKGL